MHTTSRKRRTDIKDNYAHAHYKMRMGVIKIDK